MKAAGISSLAPGMAVQAAPLQVGGLGRAGGRGVCMHACPPANRAWPRRPW